MRRTLAVGGVLIALAASGAACGSGSTSSSGRTTAPTTVPPPPPSTTGSPVTPTTVPTPPVAVWPWSTGTTRYATPEGAARGFATDFLHMVAPVVGGFRQGDARSGEVPVRPTTTGPETTVLVRQLGPDDSWWVLGAATAAIDLTAPTWNAAISSPVTLTGTSVAFEGTVRTQVRQDGMTTPLGEGFVTGGSTSMGPFRGTLAFSRPSAAYGAVVLTIISAENGAVSAASVVRVRFG